MKINKNILGLITILISIVLYIGVFIAFIFQPSDPDLGWHLRYGEYFFKTGSVLRENTFSVLMQDFRWNNSSWGTDLITYLSFHNFGFLGLSFFGALVGTLTIFFMGKAARLSIFEKSVIFPIIVYLVYPVYQISFRGQILSLLFLAILFYILSIYEKNKKTAIVLIPLFLIWGNLHGQYIFGLGIFFIWTLVYSVKEIYLNYKSDIKKYSLENRFLLFSLLLSPIAILVNPFGLGVYEEALKHFDDPFQKSVMEFLAPADFSVVWWNVLFAGIIIVIGIALLGTGRKNLNKAPFYIPSLVLYIFTFWIRRYAWPFYFSLIFLMQPVVKFFEPDSKKYSTLTSIIIAGSFLIICIYIKYPFQNITEMNWDKYCHITVGCSEKAVKVVLDRNLNNEKLLTIYDYGGYLIWNFPEIKPTIDGRMHLWRDKKGFSAFEYYYPIEQRLNGKDIDKTNYNAVLTSRKKAIFNRLAELTSQGKWKAIYADDYSVVFVRNN